MYVDPLSKVLKKHSSQVECSIHFNLILNVNGVWLELPHLKVIPPPKDGAVLRTEDNEDPQLLDLASGGLYTKSEIHSWERLLSFPQFRRAELHSIALWWCLHSGTCQVTGSAAAYDLTQLEATQWFNPWDAVKRTTAEYGQMCSIIMLAYFLLKGLINIILVSLTCIQTGMTAAIALFCDLYFTSTMAWKKIRDRHQRIQRREAELDRIASRQSQCLSVATDQGSDVLAPLQQQQDQLPAEEGL